MMPDLRRVSGASIGKRRKRVQICDTCGVMHERNPPQCYCGAMVFTKFDSKGEAQRWAQLRMFEKAGEISRLKRQVAFPLAADGGTTVGKYVADFEYRDAAGKLVVEDYKGGAITGLAEWKRRHFEAQHGFAVTIVTKRTK